MGTPESIAIWVAAHGALFAVLVMRRVFARFTGA